MPNHIRLFQDVLTYTCDADDPHNYDTGWELNLASVELVGLINRMADDRYRHYLLFVEDNGSRNFLNLSREVEGWVAIRVQIERRFGFNLMMACNQLHSNAIVLYPRQLEGFELYQRSRTQDLRAMVMLDHVADGEFSKKVAAWLEG